MNDNNKYAMQVSALCNGTVIDHIPADKLFEVVNILDIPSMTTNVTIGYNLKSRKLGTKGLIKVADKFFSDEEISRLSVVAPNVVLNIIRNFDVVEKKEVIIPDELHGIVRCSNPKCISAVEQELPHIFKLTNPKKGVYRCIYCEQKA